ncbi:MAG: replication initiation protein [Clostridium sp.]|nr:replication initiation protein [Clostridium sp.]
MFQIPVLILNNHYLFEVFYKSLNGKKLVVYGGLFKDANIMYKNEELDSYKVKDNVEYVYMMCYLKAKNEYENNKIRELTEEEKKKVNKNLIDIIEVD